MYLIFVIDNDNHYHLTDSNYRVNNHNRQYFLKFFQILFQNLHEK